MKKVAIVYWSGTGNTAAMAQLVKKGVVEAGAAPTVLEAGDFGPARLDEFDAVIFGCPAMGAEELEDGEFQPMWDEVKETLGEKKVVLFGSYGWGSGEWMDAWKADAEDAGVNVVDALIVNEEPDDEGISSCQALGAQLV